MNEMHDKQKESEENELFFYGDPKIASRDAKVEGWLKFSYLFWPLWGIVWWILYWNGSWGWLDPNYWGSLQKAANTTVERNLKSEKK